MSQNIRDQFLQCKICLDGLKEPKTLPCLHTFCADCLHYYIEHNRTDRYKFACPICRRHVYIPKDGVDGFPDSFFVSSLNDIVSQPPSETSGGGKCGICRFKDGDVAATTMCIECKIELCGECSEAHKDAKITEAHTLLSLTCDGGSGGVSRDNYCRVHRGETIKYYCETCNSAICLPCTFIDHKGHEIEEIGQVNNNINVYRISLQNSTSEAQQTKSFGMEPLKICGGKAISNKYVFIFLRKVAVVSGHLVVIGT